MTAPKRVLVSGASGFIGRSSLAPLLKRGYEVHALTSGRLRERALGAQFSAVALHHGDLLDSVCVDDLIAALRPTYLLHFAWVTTPQRYWTSAANFAWVAASLHLVRTFHAQGGTRAVIAGSCAEYDWSRVGVCYEASSPLASIAAGATPYAICKVALQNMLASYGRHSGLSLAAGRIFSPFGPHEHPQRLVPSVVRNLLSGREAPCSHGNQIRNFMHVADVGRAFAALLDSDLEGAVNIGTEEQVSIAALVACIAERTGHADLIRLGAHPAASNEPHILVPDVRRLYDELSFRPAFTLAEGLADTIAYLQDSLERGSASSGG